MFKSLGKLRNVYLVIVEYSKYFIYTVHNKDCNVIIFQLYQYISTLIKMQPTRYVEITSKRNL